MKRHLFCWVAAALLAGLTPLRASAEPIVISSIPVEFRFEGLPSGGAEGRFILFMATPIQLFGGNVITTADIGRTIVADASNEARFADFATRATNGRPNFVELGFFAFDSASGFGAPSEGQMFNLGPRIADFKGFTLTSLNLHVTDFFTAPSSRVPGLIDVGFNGSLAVLGTGALAPATTPEPASMVLFATGAIGVAWLRRRRGTVD